MVHVDEKARVALLGKILDIWVAYLLFLLPTQLEMLASSVLAKLFPSTHSTIPEV
jgi:hypothetical protein